MSKFIESIIECPFYVKEGEGFILCEGVIKNTTSRQEFKSDYEKSKFETEVCSVKCGKNCFHHRNLATLYEKGLKA